jgi:glycosyltransferase involved in cell wall biosynthesis
MIISIVIPVYMNADGLKDLANELVAREREFTELGSQLQVVFVVDGSPDNSLEILLDLRKVRSLPQDSKVVKLSRNFGQISALLAGLEVADGECMICYSADMQDPSKLFLNMYEHFRDGNEVVIATRESRSDGFIWDMTSKFGYALLRREVPNIPKGGFDFFLIGRKARKVLMERAGSKRFLQADILHLGFQPVLIGYPRLKRKYGKSGYSFRRRLEVFVDAFYDSSDLPIKVATRFGFTLSICGFLSTLFILFSYFRGDSPFNGFAAIASAILILGGLQLGLIGIIGEYIYRIYDISRNRPRFIIENIY